MCELVDSGLSFWNLLEKRQQRREIGEISSPGTSRCGACSSFNLACSKDVTQSFRYHDCLSVQLVSEVSGLCHR